MKFQQLAELGYVCGLTTFGEAVTMVQLHWDAWSADALRELDEELHKARELELTEETLLVHFLGAERCAQIDAEVHATLSKSLEADTDESFTL